MAISEQALLEFLHGLVGKIGQSFRTEAEIGHWHAQVDKLVEEVKDDVKEDVAQVANDV